MQTPMILSWHGSHHMQTLMMSHWVFMTHVSTWGMPLSNSGTLLIFKLAGMHASQAITNKNNCFTFRPLNTQFANRNMPKRVLIAYLNKN